MLAVNLFHMRGGRVVDRREFFWEDLPEDVWVRVSDPDARQSPALEPSAGPSGTDTEHVGTGAFAVQASAASPFLPPQTSIPVNSSQALLKQLYIGQPYVPRNLYVPVDFEDRSTLEDLLSEQAAGSDPRAARVHILVPQPATSAPSSTWPAPTPNNPTTSVFACSSPMPKPFRKNCGRFSVCPELPRRIECFDISHIQGARP